ncbi:MAG: Eco57I restriction-modification methylase domain-containing protein [Methanomethylovorans sp.]|uniref:Eco57I restriction-modification methylase domain-containing protein n=1 Tax=Methanomethylovorans sp. TaxID=2758717 RepID=UPI003530C76E
MQVLPIMSDTMPAPSEIIELVERFDQYSAKYKSNSYNETQVRREFIDPLFKALGWDVDNTQAYDERYKEVIHEDAVKVGGKTKAPDYSFRIGGVRKFFVEAKKPAVNLKENPEPAYQLRRYAWSAKLPVSILTDFEEFIVFDCTRKPSPNDNSSLGRIEYYTYKDYISKWDEIASKYSKKAVFTGKFDDLADSLVQKKGGKGTAGIDDAFLAEIEGWRDELAKNLALRNASLSVRELNLAVQKIIDRIVFLRICEDRGIEEYGQLKSKAEGKDVYKNLIELFLHADDKYNSGLFHFRSEDGMEEPDILTTSLEIDDKTLKHIISRLYYPESPYEFSVIPADILGQVYEQFLGKVIRLTASHQAKIEEKPEVKKAGGVYYTPTYIVEYIVKNTIGKLVENKTPAEVSNLKIVDPACGSGSFLIGAYQYLLNWHLDCYMNHLVPLMKEGKAATDKEVQKLLPAKPVPTKRGKKKARSAGSDYDFPIYQMSEDDWRLTSDEKKRILLNNIYGVDIDQQAVEVTKLSLLLKVLEGEKGERISKQLTITQERVLPSLHENIKCGNSLIGSDVYSSVQMNLDNDDEFYKINAFDWNQEFPDVFEQGGFDAVIGNPPWGATFNSSEQKYLKTKLVTANSRNIDSYVVFIEAGLSKLKLGGLLSFITPDTFLRKDDHVATRRLLLENTIIYEMIETGPVFSKVRDTWCLVFRVGNEIPATDSNIFHKNLSRYIVSAEERLELFGQYKWDSESEVPQLIWSNRPDLIFGYFTSTEDQRIIKKIELNPNLKMLEDFYSISRGEEGSKFSLNEDPNSNFYMVIPNDIARYHYSPGIKISTETLSTKKIEDFYCRPKIWIIRIQKMRWKQRLVCTLDDRCNSAGMKTLQMIISKSGDIKKLFYLLGILCSSLINYYCINYLADDLNKSYLSKLPICTIDPSNPEDVARHDRMVSLVEQMLELHKKLDIAKLGSEKEMIQRRINATDAEIDRLVYELYGLTEEEIAIVEGKSA